MATTNSENQRYLCDIAREIKETWKNPSVHAMPYINAMLHLTTIDTFYDLDPARDIVNYFLSNAATWRGADARRIKAELNSLLKSK